MTLEQTTPDPTGEPGPEIAAAVDTTTTTVDTPVIKEAHKLPDTFERDMAEMLGEIGLPTDEPSEGEGEETLTETEADDELVETPDTTGQVFKGKAQVFGEEIDVNLNGDELKAVVQKGLAYDRKIEKVVKDHTANIEKAVAAERERYTSDPYSNPNHREYLSNALAFNATAAAVFEEHPEFKEDFLALVEESRRKVNANVERVRGVFKPTSTETSDEKPMTVKEFKAWQDSQKVEQAKEAEAQQARERFIKDASEFKQKHPRLDTEKIKQVAKTALEKGLDFNEAYALLRGKNLISTDGQPPKPDAGKGILANKKIPRIPAGAGNLGGPLKEPPLGASAEEVRQFHINRLKTSGFNVRDEMGV